MVERSDWCIILLKPMQILDTIDNFDVMTYVLMS